MAVILPQSVQQGIQEALPVIPNNGNPGGAYNMASAAPAPQQAPVDPYAWVKPSPYMGMVDTILQQQDVQLEETIQSVANPQTKGLYNWGIRDGNLSFHPLNDFALPFEQDDVYYPMTNPRDVRLPLPQGE